MPALKQTAARLLAVTRGYYPCQWAIGRVAGGFILAYHDLPAATFERHILALAPNRPVPLGELLDREASGRSSSGLFAITFDDGVATTVRDIAATCLARGWPVTFYLPTGYLDEPGGIPFQRLRAMEPYLTAAEVRELERAMRTEPRPRYEELLRERGASLVAAGRAKTDDLATPEPISWAEVTALARHELLDFQSHGVTHTAVSALAPDELERELTHSRDRIQAHTGRPCRHFCYPYGSPASIGDRAPEVVARHYDSATTLSRGRVRGRSRTLLPRIPLYTGDDAAMARLKVLTR